MARAARNAVSLMDSKCLAEILVITQRDPEKKTKHILYCKMGMYKAIVYLNGTAAIQPPFDCMLLSKKETLNLAIMASLFVCSSNSFPNKGAKRSNKYQSTSESER